MIRFGHRVKTHGTGWHVEQPVPGVYLWRTPHGYWYRVDADGTHALGKNPDPTRHHPNQPDQPAPPQTPARAAPRDPPRTPMEQAFADLISNN
jgi:hypothetical protein